MPQLANGLGLSRARFSGGGFVGPLDAYTTGLVDAFSAEFRLLTAHEGGLFNVRESVGSTEEVIGCTSAGRLNQTAFNAHIGAGIGLGVEWINQTGATNFIQTADATRQGQIVLNAVGSGAVLRLDNSNDRYDAIRTLTRPWTIYLVEKGNGGGSHRTLCSSGGNSLISTTRATLPAFIEGVVSDYTQAAGSAHVAALSAPSGGNAVFWLDSVDRTTNANTSEWGGLALAGGPFGEVAWADVCEILVYNVAHDASTVAAITAILNGLREIS